MTLMPQFKHRLPAWLHTSLLFVLFTVLTASRRHWQYLSPQVWAEDGTNVIPGLALHGWASFIEPVNGYLITLPKLITMLALSISVVHYPLISSLISAACMGLVATAIALSPTHLRGRFLCALAVCMVPMDPEVFGLPLYMFWWSSLLLFLLALWDEEHAKLAWRLLFLLAGGLSSPMVMLVFPLLLLRSYRYRHIRAELVLGVVICAIVALQGSYIAAGGGGTMPPLEHILINLVPVFFGHFALGGLSTDPNWLWAGGLVVIFLLSTWIWQARRSPHTWILVFLLAGAICMVVLRVDPRVLNPRLTAQRYFFFPYVLILWCLVQFAYQQRVPWGKYVVIAPALLVMLSSTWIWSQRHDDLLWGDHVRSCRQFASYDIPVETNGSAQNAWRTRLPGAVCGELLDRAWLKDTAHVARPFAYTAYKERSPRAGVELLSNTMGGMDFFKSQIEGYQVIGSYRSSDADTGEVTLKVKRGGAFLYRNGPGRHGQSVQIVGHEQSFSAKLPPADEWLTLEFSNLNLPEEFTVRISDSGREWGDWSAVAIKMN
jgi:hypothetical protein